VEAVEARMVRVELANRATMLIEAVETKKSGGMTSVALPSKLDFDSVLATPGELGSSVVEKLKVASPRKATVELKFGFAAEPGKLTALLVSGKADASLTVTLGRSEHPVTGHQAASRLVTAQPVNGRSLNGDPGAGAPGAGAPGTAGDG